MAPIVVHAVSLAVAFGPPTSAADPPPSTAGDAESEDVGEPPEPGSEQRTVVIRSVAEEMEASAEAVQVEDLRDDQARSAALGDVLKRSQGVTLRRTGGLGSRSNLSLSGLDGSQVPFLVDGIPIEFSPFSLDPANIPVGLVDRVEVYRGVVPLRFGVATLGGAVNLARDFDGYRAGTVASYQGGSFDTHRLVGRSSALLEGPNIYASVYGFFDHSRNDYDIDVETAQADGSLVDTTVARRNAQYLAGGGGVTVGVVDTVWADRLLLTGFASAYHKQVPHNIVMTVPYGSVEFGELRPGANLRYEKSLARDVSVEISAAYTRRRIDGRDTDPCVYDWFGQCIVERALPGEVQPGGTDQRIVQDGAYGNVSVSWSPSRHTLRAVAAPMGFRRSGVDARTPPGSRDALHARRDLASLTSGFEYAVDLVSGHLQNIVFVKDYLQLIAAEQAVPGSDTLTLHSRWAHQLGAGDSLRFELGGWARLKVSYEWATRFPSVDEIFGDGMLHVANLDLRPERAHNANASIALDHVLPAVGRLWLGGHLGSRFVRDAIALVPEDNRTVSQNVNHARAYSVDASAGWTSEDDWVTLDGNVSYVDYRNTSSDGPFGPYQGDRMPARPWLLANGHAAVRVAELVSRNDALTLDWNTHYTHAFFRSWESAGSVAFKQQVPSQLLHAAGITYRVHRLRHSWSTSLDVLNLLDTRAFDYVGAQLPGRSVMAKATVSF